MRHREPIAERQDVIGCQDIGRAAAPVDVGGRMARGHAHGEGITAPRAQQSSLLIGAALVTWILVTRCMRGMDAGPAPISVASVGTSLSG